MNGVLPAAVSTNPFLPRSKPRVSVTVGPPKLKTETAGFFVY